jgi:acetyl esterase/lipase
VDVSVLPNQIPLWSVLPDGSKNVDLVVTERSVDPAVRDKAMSGIANPCIVPFFPEADKACGTSVLIMPGGGYERIAIDKEGYDIASWLNTLGVAAFVLQYRLPGEGHRLGFQVPLQDAQRALRIIKHNAAKWQLDPSKTGVMGFSAGGHLASTLATRHADRIYAKTDGADDLDARPSFMILGYPVINLGQRQREPRLEPLRKYPSERHVDDRTPPAFIFHANDDTAVSSGHSVLFYQALKKANIECELHIFRTGGHGFGIRAAKGPVRLWTTLCEEWLLSSGFMTR